jgi:hypothetical protein
VRQAGVCQLTAPGKQLTVYDYKSPDCPVSQQSAGPTVGRIIRARRVARANGQKGHRTVRCAPDSVRCARLASVNWLLSGFIGGVRLKITGLSGEPTVGPANGRPRNPRATRGRANGQKGHRTVRCAPDSVRCANGSETPTVGFAKEGKKSAPDSVWCARRQKARIAFLECSQRLLVALGL